MPKVSQFKLDKKLEEEMFRQFWESLSKFQSADEVSSFFSDLLTDTEELMLAKRFAVAMLLLQGKRPTDIASSLHVSYTSIGSVASWLKNAKPQTNKIFQKLAEKNNWQAFLDRIDELFDKLPPRYGTNWSQAGKEKWERAKERSIHQTLR